MTQLVEAGSPQQLIVFGSAATGDLMVTTLERCDERSKVPGTVEFAARTGGRVLHDAG